MDWEQLWESNHQSSSFGADSTPLPSSVKPTTISPAMGAMIVLGSIYAATVLGNKLLDKEVSKTPRALPRYSYMGDGEPTRKIRHVKRTELVRGTTGKNSIDWT